ncbi:hypothetical protein WJX73_007118 [Symbiochloris irregularis]|uniref:Uncharacterized protein n=1 Tax=Symbiochloris irregularis TaxID=706552 RepID=A0AAW1NZU0_9CHLO
MSGGGRDIPGTEKQSYLQGMGQHLSNSAKWAKDSTMAGANSVQKAASARDWSREKGWADSAGNSVKGAASWTKDKTVTGAGSVKTAAQERDWTREKGWAASAGAATLAGTKATGKGLWNGTKYSTKWLWNAGNGNTEVIDHDEAQPQVQHLKPPRR